FVESAELFAIFGRMKFLSTITGSLAMLYRLMLRLRQATIDNHRMCVTVAAGLLKNETTKSYIWLLKAFIKAFEKAPSIVVADQDGAMRNAIEAEFAGSKHRLCMWHITQKLPAKVPPNHRNCSYGGGWKRLVAVGYSQPTRPFIFIGRSHHFILSSFLLSCSACDHPYIQVDQFSFGYFHLYCCDLHYVHVDHIFVVTPTFIVVLWRAYGFRGFPNLLSLHLCEVGFKSYKYGEFLAQSPLLDTLKLTDNTTDKVKLVEIAKLKNLKMLSLTMCELENMMLITSSSIFQLVRFFPKIQELVLRCSECMVLADAEKTVLPALMCLKTLRLCSLNIRSDIMVSFVTDMICGFLNLETLTINTLQVMDIGCRLSTSSTQGKVSSIPTVFSWIDNISSDGFLSFILLVVVIMVTIIMVVVVLEIVVVVIVGVVIIVTGGVSSIFKFLFVIIGFLCRLVFYYMLHQPLGYGWAYAFHQDKASLVRVPVANVTLSSLAHLLRENTDSLVLLEQQQYHQKLIAGWQPDPWMVLQRLML
nr:hypothetical protein [Tanacetum cinerariifolium]